MSKSARVTRGQYRGQEKADDPREAGYQREQDEWQRSMVRSVAEAIEDWLSENAETPGRRLTRRINQLTIEELEGMGVAACDEYVRQREARRLQEPKSPILQDWELGT